MPEKNSRFVYDEYGFPICRISWTMLQRMESCVRMVKLFADGKREPISNSRNFLTGNIVDNAQRKWLELEDPSKVSLVDFGQEMYDYWTEKQKDTIKWRTPVEEDRKRVMVDTVEALQRLEPWLLENVIPYPYQPEARGTTEIYIPDWNGIKHKVDLFFAVDIAVQRPDGWWLMDLKTTRNNKYVSGHTLAQLTYYSLAWSIHHKQGLDSIVKKSFITPLAKDFETEVRPTQEDFAVMLQRIQKYAWIMWKEDYSPTKTEVDYECRNQCDVRRHCPLGQAPKPDASGKFDFMSIVNQRKEMGTT